MKFMRSFLIWTIRKWPTVSKNQYKFRVSSKPHLLYTMLIRLKRKWISPLPTLANGTLSAFCLTTSVSVMRILEPADGP
jgi:hypothetical protein